MYHISVNHLSAEGHLGCFSSLAIVIRAAVRLGSHFVAQTSLDLSPILRLLGSMIGESYPHPTPTHFLKGQCLVNAVIRIKEVGVVWNSEVDH